MHSAFANSYKINYLLEVGSTKPLAGAITVEKDKTTSISLEDFTIKLVLTEKGAKTVKISADIWENSESNLHKQIGTCALITKLNNTAKITEIKRNAQYSLTVTPKRVP